MKKLTVTGKDRLNSMLAILAVVVVALSASQALASIPNSSTGIITSCYNSSGALRVVDSQQGAACAAGETQLTWNSTTISATQWGSGAVRPITRAGGVAQVVQAQPGNKLPAGSWVLSATVMLANSLGVPTSFRCHMRTRGGLVFINGQLQDWNGGQDNGWHHTMTIPGLVTLTEPDWIDVSCSHDQNLPSGGSLQVEETKVIAQRVAATF